MRRQRRQVRVEQGDLFDEALKRTLCLDATGSGGTIPEAIAEQQVLTASARTRALTCNLMEEIASSSNLNEAWKRVRANKGAPGVDRQTIQDLRNWIGLHKDELVADLLTGRFQPSPVRGVEIPKPGGGMRQLGIPTVLDRLVQQAILQVLEPVFDPGFSESSFGFRPGRSAHAAVLQGQAYVADGYGIVVDLDLEKFFDRVNHDILMSRLARRIGDKRLLRIIRRFLEAGMLQDGVCVRRKEGTPQGGPLSPLLANILLDDLDKELGKRGHRFCRYADDCNIYVRSLAAGERVMASVTRFLEHRLRLRVNRQKSAVAPVEERGFLGYRLTPEGRPTVAPKSVARAKDRLREITDRKRAIPFERFVEEVNSFLTGWVRYFRLADDERTMRNLGGWARRRLRLARLFQCRHPKGIRSLLTSLGVPVKRAISVVWTNKGWWRKARLAPTQEGMSNAWFARLKLCDPLLLWSTLQDDGNRRGTRSVRPVV